MRLNIITNLANGAGLQRCYEILRAELLARNHLVTGVQFNTARNVPLADVNIFIETVRPELFVYAHKQWVIPMPEWWDVRWFKLPFDRVLMLTQDGWHRFRQHFPQAQFLGWKSNDLYDPTIPREPRFLHVAGKSPYKNTEAVVEGCRQAGAALTVVAQKRISEAELKGLANSHLFHIMPSMYEGYGYVLHEALSVGAVLITTAAAPMNEVHPALYVPIEKMIPHHAAVLYKVTAEQVAHVVRQALQLSATERATIQRQARAQYEAETLAFHGRLETLLETSDESHPNAVGR